MHHLGKIGLGILAFFVLATGSASAACSNSSASGVYGYSVHGFGGPSTPVATVGLFTADGAGNITAGKTTASINGQITTATFTGTYSIASDCTGTVTTTDSNSNTNHYFVVLSGTKLGAIDLIGADTGATVSGSAHSQGVGVCGLTGKAADFAEHLTGYAGSVLEAVVGKLSTDGNGNIINGIDALSADGKIIKPSRVSGTYTANSDCTGTAHITYRGTTYNYNYVTVDASKQYLVIETDDKTTIAGTLAKQ
jgi:hypothetical protein